MKQLTIAVGPQGSGNHLYAKLFGSNKNIYGWQSLQEKYWEGHDMEPFSDYWQNPEFLLDFDTTNSPSLKSISFSFTSSILAATLFPLATIFLHALTIAIPPTANDLEP